MKRTTGLKVVGIMILILIGCASAAAQEIRYNFLPGTDFAKYKTYRWARVPNAEYPDQIIDTQITQAIDAQLAAKGLSKSSGETADLVVTYQTAINTEKQWNSYSSGDMGGGWGYGRWGGWGGYGGGMSTTTTTSETIRIGTLDVDIYETAAKNQIWKGQATKTLGSGKDPAKVNKNINKAMEKLFKKYPPPVKK